MNTLPYVLNKFCNKGKPILAGAIIMERNFIIGLSYAIITVGSRLLKLAIKTHYEAKDSRNQTAVTRALLLD